MRRHDVYVLRDVHSHFYLQEESLSWFLSAVELSVYQLKIKDDQEKNRSDFLDAFDTIKSVVSFPLKINTYERISSNTKES